MFSILKHRNDFINCYPKKRETKNSSLTSVSKTIDILKILIQILEKSIKYQVTGATILIILGVILFIIPILYGGSPINNETINRCLQAGGLVITALGAYPHNQIIIRIEKLRILKFFLRNFLSMEKNQRKEVEDFIHKAIGKLI